MHFVPNASGDRRQTERQSDQPLARRCNLIKSYLVIASEDLCDPLSSHKLRSQLDRAQNFNPRPCMNRITQDRSSTIIISRLYDNKMVILQRHGNAVYVLQQTLLTRVYRQAKIRVQMGTLNPPLT